MTGESQRATQKAAVTPHPAATVTLVRDTPSGIEVLMLKRSLSLKFMPGVYVFPGGALDPADSAPEIQSLCVGREDAAAGRSRSDVGFRQVRGDALAHKLIALARGFLQRVAWSPFAAHDPVGIDQQELDGLDVGVFFHEGGIFRFVVG